MNIIEVVCNRYNIYFGSSSEPHKLIQFPTNIDSGYKLDIHGNFGFINNNINMKKFKNTFTVTGSTELLKAFCNELNNLGHNVDNSMSAEKADNILVNIEGADSIYRSFYTIGSHKYDNYELPQRWTTALRLAGEYNRKLLTFGGKTVKIKTYDNFTNSTNLVHIVCCNESGTLQDLIAIKEWFDRTTPSFGNIPFKGFSVKGISYTIFDWNAEATETINIGCVTSTYKELCNIIDEGNRLLNS